MTIAEFFANCNLNITFDDPFDIDNFQNMFDHFRLDYESTEETVKECLMNSYKYETDNELGQETIMKLIKTNNNIEELYHIIEPHLPVVRKRSVHVNGPFGTVFTGAKCKYINIPTLQMWVDQFHSFEFENDFTKIFCGFVLYLLYVRIHPHEDGNGRMSRYLFLENKLLTKHNLCPLSIILKHNLILPNKHMQKIFDILDNSLDPAKVEEEDYYKLHVSGQLLRLICYVIYITICYKYAIFVNPEIKTDVERCTDFCSLFCLGKANINIGKSVYDKFKSKRRDRNGLFINKLNKIFDFNTHIEILQAFHLPW